MQPLRVTGSQKEVQTTQITIIQVFQEGKCPKIDRGVGVDALQPIKEIRSTRLKVIGIEEKRAGLVTSVIKFGVRKRVGGNGGR